MNHLVRDRLITVSAGGLTPYTGPELFGWWDPSDSLNVTKSGGRFDQVNDKSGNLNHLTSAGSLRPFDSRTVNGLEVLDFQGGQNISVNFSAQNQPNVYIHVSNVDFFPAYPPFHFDAIHATNRNVHVIDTGTSQQYLFAGSNLKGGTINTSVNIYTLIFNGVNSLCYLNGVLQVNGDSGSNSMEGIIIGDRPSGGRAVDGVTGDFIMYNNLITTAHLNQTGQYLADKYAISYTDI